MGIGRWGDEPQISAKEYETQHGEKRVAKRIETPAGVASAVKQADGTYKIWRMDQFLGFVMKRTRPTLWVAQTPDGKPLRVLLFSTMKSSVERLQMATPVSDSIQDVATKQYAEQLVKRHGPEEARNMTFGPARKAVEQFIDVFCPADAQSRAAEGGANLSVDAKAMMCGNCEGRNGEECDEHGGREIYLDDEKPDWCEKWQDRGTGI